MQRFYNNAINTASRPMPTGIPLPKADADPQVVQAEEKESENETTQVLQRRSVEQVILQMRQSLDHPLSLNEMAEIAHLSRFHFNRVFSSITGVSPRKFLATLRLEHAKRLLLTTDQSITEVCYETGYSSLGTFTSHFTDLVGVPPRRWRQLREDMKISMEEIASLVGAAKARSAEAGGNTVSGTITTPEGFQGLIFIGLFKSNVPQSYPSSGDMALGAGPYNIMGVPDGTYYMLAVAIDWPLEPLDFFVPDRMLRGRCGPITVADGEVTGETTLALREPHLTDPPILIALPYLFVEYLKISSSGKP
jgi:AraC-like DNA-binding protein